MEGHCSTGQSPQWAVVPMEEEEHISDMPIPDTVDNVENSIHANVQTLELHRN